ncbi:hypothetical protein [Paraburkholderia phenazinium]|uniref:hypothetical protein n=1 Tax=Paraburkholderia phenazinium TaxID=60549 RepID=UPI00158EBAA3|nr:hypothetical protein [Paraburkholderia phenazinium]
MTYHAVSQTKDSVVVISGKPLTVSLLTTCIVLAACSNKKDATQSNFEEAIKAGLATGPSMCVTVAASWPDDVRDTDDRSRQLRPFVNASLLSAKPITIPDMFGRKVPGHRYNVTEAGQQFAERGAFCYGKARFVKLLSWDPVTTAIRISTTKAFFTYEIDGLAGWATRDDVQAAFPNLRTVVQGQDHLKMQMKLIMDSDHWHKE